MVVFLMHFINTVKSNVYVSCRFNWNFLLELFVIHNEANKQTKRNTQPTNKFFLCLNKNQMKHEHLQALQTLASLEEQLFCLS